MKDKSPANSQSKQIEGIILSNSMDKTLVVGVERRVRHRLYGKELRRITKCYVHDPDNKGRVGCKVRIEETRPLSRLKRWRLIKILQEKA